MKVLRRRASAQSLSRRAALFAVAIAAAPCAAFLFLAVWRRLNFDESLALRAGLLELDHANAAPAFVMPWTLLMGALGRAVDDPGCVFTAARLATAGLVLGAAILSFARVGLAGARLGFAMVLTVQQGAFLAHGLEFRYDAAILIGVLVLSAAVAAADRPWPSIAGVAVAWLAVHHLKGLFFAVLLGAWCVAEFRGSPRNLRRFLVGSAVVAVCWVATLSVLGLHMRWLTTLRHFWQLSQGVARVPIANSLGSIVMYDLAWWLIVTLALLSMSRELSRRSVRAEERALLVPAAVALGFVVAHPHAWAYMLAVPAPLLAGLVSQRFPSVGARPNAALAWFAVMCLGLAAQIALTGRGPLTPWRVALRAPIAPVVKALRDLRATARPGEAVLDPSGLAYFLRPCTLEWYVDGLFAQRVSQARWMTELSEGAPPECIWVLDTYRLQAIPLAARLDLRSNFRFFGSGLGLRFPDPAGVHRAGLAAMETGGPLTSYWY